MAAYAERQSERVEVDLFVVSRRADIDNSYRMLENIRAVPSVMRSRVGTASILCRWRRGLRRPEADSPIAEERVDFALGPACHVF